MDPTNSMQGPDRDLALYLRGFIAPLGTVAAIATALLLLA